MKFHEAVWGIVALRLLEQEKPLNKRENKYLKG